MKYLEVEHLECVERKELHGFAAGGSSSKEAVGDLRAGILKSVLVDAQNPAEKQQAVAVDELLTGSQDIESKSSVVKEKLEELFGVGG